MSKINIAIKKYIAQLKQRNMTTMKTDKRDWRLHDYLFFISSVFCVLIYIALEGHPYQNSRPYQNVAFENNINIIFLVYKLPFYGQDNL